LTGAGVVKRIEFKSDRQHFADNARETDFGENGINISTVPLVIAFLFLSKHIVEGVQLGSVKM
jgi:ABC-type maltose transport system permease subunit